VLARDTFILVVANLHLVGFGILVKIGEALCQGALPYTFHSHKLFSDLLSYKAGTPLNSEGTLPNLFFQVLVLGCFKKWNAHENQNALSNRCSIFLNIIHFGIFLP
jgi:hypothetical protein